MSKFIENLKTLNPSILEEIARKSPQIKKIIEIDIADIEEYGYDYPEEKDYESVEIDGMQYYVKDEISKLQKIVRLYCCQILSPGLENIEKIYNCYCNIISNQKLLEKAKKLNYFNYCYNEHQNGNKCFTGMDVKNSIVATMLFSLYH